MIIFRKSQGCWYK